MFHSILVLSDLTDTTAFAYGPIVTLAKRNPGVRVILAHAVVATTEMFFLDAVLKERIDRKALDKARPKLEALAADLHALGVDVEPVLEVGSPYSVIFQLAERYNSELIVVPTRHQHSVVRRISNSVTARAIRAHALPVMTMNQLFGQLNAPFAGFREILHPVDFGPEQRDGLVAAEDFAAEMGGRLHLVHVLRKFDVDSVLEDDAESRAAALQGLEQMHTLAEGRLAEVCARVAAVPAESHVTRADSAGEGIVQVARQIGANCIVLPALGRDKVHTQLMGSTAEYVISHAPCPVLFHDGSLVGVHSKG